MTLAQPRSFSLAFLMSDHGAALRALLDRQVVVNTRLCGFAKQKQHDATHSKGGDDQSCLCCRRRSHGSEVGNFEGNFC